MILLKRAFLYVTRKRGKSLLLFSIIFLISTLALCGLASLDAEEETSTELRGTTGASFTVNRNLSTGGWGNGNGGSYSTQELISSEMVEKIANIDGIEAYDTSSTTILHFYDQNGKYYECINPTGYAPADSQYYTNTTINSQYSSLFLSQTFTLAEGRHITDNDKNVILISKDIADKHGLKLGDKISAVNDPDSNDPTVKVEVIGIFNVNIDNTDEKNNYNMASYYDYSNYAFTDITAMEKLLTNYKGERPSDGYSSVDFFVSDPENLESIIIEAQKINSINWDNFTITTNNEVYERTASSMSDMSSLIRALIIVIVVISMSIITLILSMWVKSRVQETGILLAAGISKVSILFQHIFEVGFIAIFSFPLSYLVSKIVARNVGSLFGKTADNVIVTAHHFSMVCGVGIVILILAILISCIPTMRLKPKEILSKTS